ncbi:MAG: universal stress protein [Deltaproteobacteria bacterium]|nr:universal stress protein [Deltaproteobacteria bacterium]MBW2070965.1 universal stress protein [Deltaproteobacteria bacterium]
MKVLVAVDQDLESRLALRYACHLLEHFDASVDAIHVRKDVSEVILADFEVPFLKTDRQAKLEEDTREVEQAISDACEICLAGKVPCTPRILTAAEPAEVIIKEARAGDYDLLVLGCHRVSAIKGMLLGQVHTQVINSCQRPVLIVRELRHINRVLVAYSGSSCDDQALHFIAPLLARKRPHITVMHVQDTELGESDEFSQACLRKGESLLKNLEHEPETKSVAGDVVDEIIREINLGNHDLVVVGAQGLGKTGYLNILSDRSLQIIRRTTRPVLLYRQKRV